MEHPDLGEVEVGGWNPKFWNQNPPAGSLLAKAVDKQTAFNMLLAKSLPKLEVTGVALQKQPDGNTLLTVTIANTGFLPDALTQAKLVKMVREGTAALTLGEGLSFAEGSAPRSQDIGTFAGKLDPEGSVKTVSWLLSGSGEATLTVRSTRGGQFDTKIQVFDF